MNRAVLLPILLLLVIIPGVALGDTVSSLTITVYKDGKALQDATIELWYNGTLAFRGVTDTNGTVTFANVTTGNYTIYVYYNGTVWEFTKTIDVNTTSIVLNVTTAAESDSSGIAGTLKSYYDTYKIPILVGVGFIVLILIAYALSGSRIPRRR